MWLKSGGYIVIDHTEALVAIDVNTGKYVGKRDFEETVLKINLEAVGEVVRQIRLRDLGGIIIIDFIDMDRHEHRDQVFKALLKALADDKARTNVLEISELGLVEMTRKRVRQSLQSLYCAPCPACKGSGVVKSDAAHRGGDLPQDPGRCPRRRRARRWSCASTRRRRIIWMDRRDAVERFQAMIGRKIVDPGRAVLSPRAVRRDVQVAADVTRPSRLSRAAILTSSSSPPARATASRSRWRSSR